ncbi:MAG: hypothetical protein KUG56_09755, partial [Kordiimonadaceae bacterium]|nr:hypothetical protein [Kordiimonadaceae bacterium]
MFLVKLVKDPLVHFFAVGVALFALVSIAAPTAQQDQILVDRQALLTFLQYRAKAFEPAAAASMLDKMPENERSQLVSAFIREEALYREAMALGLDEGDYVIRKRMIQKLEFMLEATRLPFLPSAKERHDYYNRNKHDYSVPASATFTHVFISNKDDGSEQALAKAALLLSQLRHEKASFTDALKHGDRFLYHTNYVQQPFENVKNHFGVRAANSIFSGEFPLNEWHGPILSSYGAHLVF